VGAGPQGAVGSLKSEEKRWASDKASQSSRPWGFCRIGARRREGLVKVRVKGLGDEGERAHGLRSFFDDLSDPHPVVRPAF